MRKTPGTLWMLALLVLAHGGFPCQDVTPQDGAVRIKAAAQRKGISDSALAPVLSRLNELAAKGLPTGRFTGLMVEGIAKGVDLRLLLERGDAVALSLSRAKAMVQQLEADGARDDFSPQGHDPVEDLSESVEAGLSSHDLETLQALLGRGSLSRVLAGADALSRLRAARFPEGAALRLLKAVQPDTPENEIRFLTSAVLSGRKQGLPDDAIVTAVGRRMKGGMMPSAVAKAWGGMGEGGETEQHMGQGRGEGMGKSGMGRHGGGRR